MNDTCFTCSNPATSREHVPPACLFPEAKDTDGTQDYRRNLITVPACKEHNLAKSDDDSYFLWVLSTNLPANAAARGQVATKLKRAHDRRPALGRSVLSDAKDVVVADSHSGTKHDAVEVPLDGARFQKVLELIARGLYYHHFGERWAGNVRVHADFIAFPDTPDPADVDANRLVLFNCAHQLFAAETQHGENPDVFWYRVHEPMVQYRCLMRLAFYGHCTATVFFGEDSG